MRIIGGEYRGRKLISPKGPARPSSDRLREALFNIIATEIEGASFWDLFSGSGAMGLEAASRGAAPVIMVEKHRDSLTAMKKNIFLCKADAQVIGGDVLKVIPTLPPADLIFADPPYTDPQILQQLLQMIDECDLLKKGGRLFLEAPSKKLEVELSHLSLASVRSYGKSHLHEFRRSDDNSTICRQL